MRSDDARPAPRDRRNRNRAAWLLVAAVGAAGLLAAHHPMILSGFARVQVDLGDSRLINYLLEHDYRWLRGDPNHAGLWDPPFFYPAQNVAALSDTMTGIAPLYAAIRAAGFAPDTSFQLWMLAVSVLNYAAMLHLLRRRLGASVAASAAGAFLFAFGAPRVNLLAHQQHLPHFLTVVTVDALLGLFPGRGTTPLRRAALWLSATAGLVAQLTCGFYFGYFLVLSLGVAAALALAMPGTRGPFLAVLVRDAPWLALSGALAALVLRPWVAHHLAAARLVGPRFSQYVRLYLPRPATWLYMGPDSWVGAWTARLVHFDPPTAEKEQRLGLGLATTLACLAGLYLGRRRAPVRLLAAAGAAVALILTVVPGGPLTALQYGLTLGPVALAYDARRDRPGVFSLTAGLILGLLLAHQFPTDAQLGIGLFTLLLTAAALAGWDGPRGWGLALGALTLGLALALFPSPSFLAFGVLVGGLAAAAAVLGRRPPRVAGSLGLGAAVLFTTAVYYVSFPEVLLVGSLAVPAALAARLTPDSVRPLPHRLPWAALAGAGLVLLFRTETSAWFFFYNRVPGAASLLFVSRGGLLLLIPASVGLALALDALRARGRGAVAAGIMAVCLAEQLVTTPSFDKAENRALVSALARRVGPRGAAFYYSPRGSTWPSWKPNLDAMWAGLECGKPTLNGYSGSTPPDWRGIEDSSAEDDCALLCVRTALGDWSQLLGIPLARIRWVGGLPDPDRSGPVGDD